MTRSGASIITLDMIRKVVFPLLAAGTGILACVLMLEAVLRFLPVSEGLRSLPVSEESPVLRFQPGRRSTWSKGPAFSAVNTVRTNNYGFVSDVDYDPGDGRPLISVIGDSYMEALMVPGGETGPRLLERELDGRARIYTFASSGSALSQYLAYGRYARETFGSDRMIFVIVGNDFDESLMTYRSVPGFHYFTEGPEGELQLDRIDLSPGLIRRAARRSSLALYLMNNLQVQTVPSRLKAFFTGGGEVAERLFAGNTAAAGSPVRLRDSERAVNFFLEQIPSLTGLAPERILFVVDGMRPHLYRAEELATARSSYFGRMRRFFMEEALARGFRVVDLQPAFIEAHRVKGERFEFERDNHWNSAGHLVWSRAVLDSGFLAEYRSPGRVQERIR